MLSLIDPHYNNTVPVGNDYSEVEAKDMQIPLQEVHFESSYG